MLVHVRCLETVSEKAATSWVIYKLTIGSVADGSTRILDGASLVDMTIEYFNDLVANL